MKFLATIRFDPSDDYVFDSAAAPGEWAIPGGFTFAQVPPDALTGKVGQAFANGFVSLESFGHSTFVSVGEISQAMLDGLAAGLADHMVLAHGAPDREVATRAANDELEFVLELCREANVNTVLCMSRTLNEDGEIHEEFRTIAPPQGGKGAGAHTRVWEIVDDEPATGDGAGA